MDVLPIIADEVVARYHRRATTTSCAVPDSRPTLITSSAPRASKALCRAGDEPGDKARPAAAAEDGSASIHDTGAAAAVTTELATLLTRVRLFGSDHTDDDGNVGESASYLESCVDEMVNYLRNQATMPALSLLALQTQCHTLRQTLRSRRSRAAVRHEAIAMRLTSTIVDKTSQVVPNELLGDMTLSILHRYHQLHRSSRHNHESTSARRTTQKQQQQQDEDEEEEEQETSLPAQKETAAVLCSVLPPTHVLTFLTQSRVEKTRQLSELQRVVWGIRIYNKETGNSSGAGLPALQECILAPLRRIRDAAVATVTPLQARMHRTLAVLVKPPCTLDAAGQTELRAEYHHLRQMEHVLLTVQCMSITLLARVQASVCAVHERTMSELRSLLGGGRSRDLSRTMNRDGHSHCADGTHASMDPTNTEEDANHDSTHRSLHGSSSLSSSSSGANHSGTTHHISPPKRVVYPHFVQLADAHAQALQYAEELAEMRELMRLVESSARGYESALNPHAAEDALAHPPRPPAPVTDRVAFTQSVNEAMAQAAAHGLLDLCVYRVYHRFTPLPARAERGVDDSSVGLCYARSRCALRGFCPVTFAASFVVAAGGKGQVDGRLGEGEGLLVPGVVDGDDAHGWGFIVLERAAHPTVQPSSPSSTGDETSSTAALAAAVAQGVDVRADDKRRHDSRADGGRCAAGGEYALRRLLRQGPLCFAFAHASALLAFAHDPMAYTLACLQSGRRRHVEPGVVGLMGWMDQLPREVYLAGARPRNGVPASCSSALPDPRPGSDRSRYGTEEDEAGNVHVGQAAPVVSRRADRCGRSDAWTQTGSMEDSHHDRNYRWNEWDLRREALKLANLQHMRTHSTQTAVSHFRRDNATQAYPPREEETQTMIDKAIQSPRVVQYLKGLRGTPSSRIEQYQEVFQY